MADDWLDIGSSELDSDCGDDYGRDLASALDGGNWWVHETNHTHWFILDLGQTYTIRKVKGRSNVAWDPNDVNIYVSDIKGTWGDAVATGISNWVDTNLWAETETTPKDGRYIYVEIIGTEDGSPGNVSFGDNSPTMEIFDVYGDIPTTTTVKPVNITGSGRVSINKVSGKSVKINV